MTADARRDLPALPDLSSLRHVHIIGICGTAMGTLAAMLAERGFRVTGSDAMAYPPMSTWLAARGLTILEGYDAAHVPDDVDLVVVGNVARRDNPESVAAHERGLPCISLPEALRVLFFDGRDVLCVTGTHGKTTTTSMLSWLLYADGADPSFLVGGVTRNFDSNFRLGAGPSFVIEGDEYDTAWFDKVPKFWHYPARWATINNIEFDHVDIYPDVAAIEHVFARFAAGIPADGALWVNGDCPRSLAAARLAHCRVGTFGLGDGHDLSAAVEGLDGDGTRIRVRASGVDVASSCVPMLGDYNVRNFLGAAALAREAGVPLERSCEHIAGFEGVKKRLDVRGEVDGIVVYDDFAHHPTAVAETVTALRRRYPQRRLWVIFEAKSNTSRRSVFQDAYPPSFELADIVVLSQPWKKDALPEHEKLSIERLAEDIRARGPEVLVLPTVDEIVPLVAERARRDDVIAGLSGSAFDGLHDRIVDALRRR